ncbi:MAG: HEAT repeat domain-containing protein [Firmicutes bacterium]|nr:HEAT repeat domain-containing protein [Bacillota bacterium]
MEILNSVGNFFVSLWFDYILPFFFMIGNWCINTFNTLYAAAQSAIQQNVFWQYALLAAGILLVLVILIVIIQKLRRRAERKRLWKKKQAKRKSIEEQKEIADQGTVFMPEPMVGIEENQLLQKLLTAPDWNDELYELCRTEGPAFIFTLASAWLRIPPQIKQGLAELALNEKWAKQYISRMDNFRYTADYAMLLWDLAPDPDCLPLLADLLGAREQRVQLAAVDLIDKIRDKRMIPYLVANLLRPEHFVTARVGEALVCMGIDSAKVCVEMLPRSEEKEQVLLLEVLSLFNCDYPIENVLDCLNSPSEKVRARAAKTLGAGKRQKALDRLTFALRDDNAQVRAAAVLALGELKAKSALPAIEALQKDDDWAVRVNSKKVADSLKNKK